MCWYFNVSFTTSYVSSIWMICSTGHHSMSYLFDWSIIIQENGSIYFAVHGGACSMNCMLAVWIASVTESEMIIGKTECLRWILWLLNLKWSLGRQIVWDDYYDDEASLEIMVTFICFPVKSILYCPKPRIEFWYWNTSDRWVHFQVRQRSCFESQLRYWLYTA